ncbi:MAG: hypothetical protein A2W71_00685 [Candidatus Nealsonbacteria bacterium RIFCSPLOWO2_02_39_8]|uniref:SbsA Ig-like domain-containing protein n=1 Tax=Candidatus Nealsonbacteria bacterium RIFCSPLOWO2_02_39_8 TaxID=1801674 RepID=A0A1G2EJQ3_9BACT|nr:MAG: hypothetical protein A2W71_00685 [Candidatus Nealsonbacteria bacterium RIFCSPLOWO2_02_39_8]
MTKNIFGGNLKKVFSAGLTAMFILSGFFIAASPALAAHTATVSVNRALVKGGSTNIYTFSITNNGADSIYLLKINAPTGFTIADNLSCPADTDATFDWSNTSNSSDATCQTSITVSNSNLVASGETISMSITAIAPIPGSDTNYNWIIYTEDRNGDSSTNGLAQTIVDNTLPVIQSITTKDANGDGKVETAAIFFSEPVLDSSFSVNGFTLGGATATSIETGTADDNTFDIVVATGVVGTEAKDVTYAQGAGSDLVGNFLANVATGTIVEIDGAAPVLMFAKTVETNKIKVTFSEDLNGNTVTNADFSMAGYMFSTDASELNGVVTLTTATAFGAGDKPAITYNTTVSNGVEDLVGIQALAAGPVVPTDGVKPNIVSSKTLTATTIEVTFTEAMSAVDKGDFNVAINTIDSVTFVAPATTAILNLYTAIGTGDTPQVSTIASPVNTKDNATVPNIITGDSISTPTDGIAPTITATAPATNAFINTQEVSYTLSEAVAAGSGKITFMRTGGSEDATVHTCVLQGTALNVGVHTNLILTTGGDACEDWVNPLVSSAIYTVTFNASDSVGNSATMVTNTGVTYDVILPNLTTVHIASNNASNNTLAKVGDTITLTFVASENLASKPTVNIATHLIDAGNVVQGTDAKNWTATYIMTGSDAEGAVPFTIDFTDFAANQGSSVMAVKDSSSVTFDKTAPTVPTAVTFTAIGGIVVANTVNTTNTNFTGGATIIAGEATGGYAELLISGNPFSTPIKDNTIADQDTLVFFDAGLTSNTAVQTQITAGGVLSARLYDAAGNYIDNEVANPIIIADYIIPTFASVALGADEYVNASEATAGVNIAIITTGVENGRTVSCTITSTTGNVGPVTGAITDNAVIIASGALNGLADGNITATCSVSDTTGNPAVNGTDIAEKDVVAPTAPVIAHIAVDEKINIAEKAAIVVVGTAESGSIINVSLSDAIHTVSNSGVATGGAYSITIDGTTLTDGTITPSVIATDAAGNVSGADTDPTAAQDTALPTIISITSNATGVGWLKVGNSIIFTLTPGSAEVGASVVGSYNGVVLFWNTANGGGTYTATYTIAEGNAHQTSPLQISGVVITDAVGNPSAAGSGIDIQKTIDADTPSAPTTVTLLDPINNANKTAATLHITGEAGTTYNYSIDDATPGSPIAGSGALTGGDLTVSGIDVSGFADGLLTVSVTLTDVAGNTGSTGIDTATKDATPPNAPIITIPASSPVVINVANKSTQTLSGAAEAGSIVEIYVNNLASTVTKVATNGTFIFTNEDLRAFGAGIVSDTDYSSAKVATVKASDAVGNFSVESNAISYTQDATVPSFTMQYYSDEGLTASLADNKRLKQGTYYIKITSSEPLNSTPTIFIDAEGTANDVTDSATVFISGNDYRYARLIAFDTAAVGGILENISITGADVAGNPATSVDPTNEATKAAYTDTVAPTAAISGQPVSPTNSNSVDITVGGTDVTHYQYKLDGGSYGIEIPIATHIILSGLGESQHTLFVIGRDVAGNWQAEPGTATLTWTVDTQAPTATLTNTPNSLTNQTTTDITVGGTDVTHYQYKIDTGLYNSETAVATHIVLSGLSGGAHTISVIGRDVAGNLQLEANAISYSWTIDTAVPSVSSHTPSLNALNISPTTQIVVTFSEAVNVESGDVLFSPTISSGFAITNSGTTVATITPNSSLSNNTTYTITLSGVADLAGNVLPEYGNIKFTTATTYSIALNTNSGGWNLISLPVIPTSTAIDEVLGGAANNIDAVWTYDPTAPNAINGWLVYTGAPNTSNLDMMTAGLGYWISVTGNANLSGSGTLLIAGHTLPPSRSLEAGWNLVGYYQLPGESNSTPAKAFASLQSWSGLWGFNNTTGIFNSVTAINPGDAFWISLTSDKIYTPSN